MQATFAKRDMIAALSQVIGAAAKRPTIPSLACVLIETTESGLSLQTNDLYMGLSGSVKADKVSRGNVAIPAHSLLDRVKAMPDGPLVLTVDDNATATLKGEGRARKFVVRGMPGKDFPAPPRLDDGAPTTAIKASVLAGLVAKVAGAISTDETRAHLNSMLLEWEGTTVRAVSTDGHRLHLAETTVEGVANFTMLIPLKGVLELKKVCESSETITIGRTGANAFFAADGFTLAIKLVDGNFPPYRQVIPSSHLHDVKVSATALRDVVRAVGVVNKESKTAIVKLAFAPGSTVRVFASDHAGGDSEDTIEVESTWKGESFAIGFDGNYLSSALEAAGDEVVSILLTGELDPLLLVMAGAKCVVMPCRIQ